MVAQSKYGDFGVTSSRSGAWVSICETSWGYIIQSDTEWSNRAALIERVCAMAGIAFLVAASGQWLFPQVHAAIDFAHPERVASTLGLAMPALMFLWISDRGMTREVQVDVTKSCLRLCVRNRRGKTRVLRAVPFERIASAYVKRSGAPGAPAQLFLRLHGHRPVMHIASGREATLRVLHGRLNEEIRPARTQVDGWERVGRKLQPTAA